MPQHPRFAKRGGIITAAPGRCSRAWATATGGQRRQSAYNAGNMSTPSSAGAQLRQVVRAERPLQIAGAINAYTARLAEAVGFRALYLSGGGVAMNSLGVPDLGISNPDDVLTDIRRITDVTSAPLLVDADTGWGGAFNIARTVREFGKAGAAGLHIEDQVQAKRCGHRPGKEIVPRAEMVDRIKAAVDARDDDNS